MLKAINMEIKKIKVFGWENALYGMRLPKNSEEFYDSYYMNESIFLGEKDKNLLLRLTLAGKDHRKILRMVHVQALVNMSFNWWKQYDTYKVGTTAISRSTMHKCIGNKPLIKEDFYVEVWNEEQDYILNKINEIYSLYVKEKDNKIKNLLWRRIIDMLPLSLLQERMIDINYEILINILNSRYEVEKLSKEWNYFCKMFLDNCPYLNDIYNITKQKRSLTTEEFDNLKI